MLLSITVGMVTYCVGSARQKREYFREADGVVFLDNVEVLFCASEDGRNYFAFGDIPFGNFSVEEYVRYMCAAVCEPPAPSEYRALGLNPRRLLKRLAPAELRAAELLALGAAGTTDKAVVVNLDGAKYSRRNAAALKRIIAAVAETYVCVTDDRFFKRADSHAKLLKFGRSDVARGARPAFYAAKRLAKKLGAKHVAIF